MADNYGEIALLQATRDYLIDNTGLSSTECKLSIGQQAIPPLAGSGFRNAVITSGGVTRGPRHGKSGHVRDQLFSVRILCVVRVQQLPKDRIDKQWFDQNATSLSSFTQDVMDQLDWNYAVINNANTLITEQTGSTEGFIKPLVFLREDPPISFDRRLYDSSIARSMHEGIVAIGRWVTFGEAQRMQAIV